MKRKVIKRAISIEAAQNDRVQRYADRYCGSNYSLAVRHILGEGLKAGATKRSPAKP